MEVKSKTTNDDSVQINNPLLFWCFHPFNIFKKRKTF